MNEVTLTAAVSAPYNLRNPLAVFDLRSAPIDFYAYYFPGRISFLIGGVDLGLSSQNIPVLGYAIGLKYILNQLSEPGEGLLYTYVNEQTIRLARPAMSEQIVVDPTWREGSIEVAYEELLQAADRFLQGLLDDLSVKFPELTENEAYPKWRAL